MSTAQEKLREKLIDYVQDARAMEQHAIRMLESMANTSSDPQMRGMLLEHRDESVEHERRLDECLDRMGRSASAGAEIGGALTSWFKGLTDKMRSDKAGKNVRDGWIFEQAEVAGYELLERLARRAGDTQTADVARRNRAEDQAMAHRLGGCWDRAIDLTLDEAGIQADVIPATSRIDSGTMRERGREPIRDDVDADLGMGIPPHKPEARTREASSPDAEI